MKFPLHFAVFALTFLALTSFGLGAAEKPNILWIVSEDNSAKWLGCYGNDYARTPNLDQLAREGMLYAKAFANAPVCAAQRATWLSGRHSLATGNLPMRGTYDVPGSVAENNYVRHLNDAGYHTHNGNKTDFNSAGDAPFDTADETGVARPFDEIDQAPWRRVAEGTPFFCIINLHVSHESVINRGPFRGSDPGEGTALDPADYYPNTPGVRANYDSYHKNITEMDRQVGVILDLLQADGHADDTIVVYTSDHGGVMYPSKRFIFQYGIHVPLIIRIPEAFESLRPGAPGERLEEIISYVDLPATFISLAGGQVPEPYDGRAFLGPDRDPPRDYHFAYRERMDYLLDNARAVHDGQYLYIRNYAPYAPWVVPFQYHFQAYEAAQDWQAAFEAGTLPPASEAFWLPKNRAEELYNTETDPDCLENLAADPEQRERLQTMRTALRQWQLDIHDAGLMPESMRDRLAAQANVTVYELVRDLAVYDLPALLDAADLTTSRDPANFNALMELTAAEDPALRYWGVNGLLMLAPEASLPMDARLAELLQDDAHEVQAYAAWALIKRGQKERQAFAKLSELIQSPSFATLHAMNIAAWMGVQNASPLRPALEKYLTLSYDARRTVNETGRMRKLPNYEEDYAKYLLQRIPQASF